MQQETPSPKTIVSAGPGMTTSEPGGEPAYIVTTDIAVLKDPQDVYGFSLSRYTDQDWLELMVEDQTNCPIRQSEMTVILERDRLVASFVSDAVAGLGIPTDYVVLFSATDELLGKMDAALRTICGGIADYSRRF
jgi:hypothetical protein